MVISTIGTGLLMKATMRCAGFVMVLALLPAVAGGQVKPAEKKPAAKPAMQHDMSKMGKDTAMKAPMAGMQHDMTGMTDSAMKARMKGMKPSDEPKSGWKELDHFHALMQGAWHGALDDDLRLAKGMSTDVVKGAVALEASKGPAGCDNAAARKEVPGVTAAARAYADVVANKRSDADVKASLRKVHDTFEKVMAACMGAKSGMKD